jgi:hypothetical protein
MPKPLEYYLSNEPSFSLLAIARLEPDKQVELARLLLNLASPNFMPSHQYKSINQQVAEMAQAEKGSIDLLNTREKIQLANAVLMVACDAMALDSIPF